MFVRKIQFKTSWEENAENFRDLELLNDEGLPDMELSVYQIEADHDQRVRILAEHCAGAGIDPPRSGTCSLGDVTNLDGIPELHPGSTGFSFADSQHHNLRFSDGNALLALAAGLLMDKAARRLDVDPKDIYAHVNARIAEQDAEWVACLASLGASKAQNWRRKCKLPSD